MPVYDISQEVFSCRVYPGDPAPSAQTLCNMAAGDLYNLTAFSMCAHNGTHVDAPRHFLHDGPTVDQLPLEAFVGPAVVIGHEGNVSAHDAQAMLAAAQAAGAKRLLIRGAAVVTHDAAAAFAAAGLLLVGNESQTVGPEDAPMAVHKTLLGAGVVLLEGVRLAHVPDGAYWLCAAPLNLGGAEGAPCRAILATLPLNT